MNDGRPRVQRDGDRPSYPYNEVKSSGNDLAAAAAEAGGASKKSLFQRQLSADGTDEELVQKCLDKNLLEDLARYAVEKRDNKFWVKVLGEKETPEKPAPPQRAKVIRFVLDKVLPKTKNDEERMSVVKALKHAEMSAELVELLDTMLVQGRDFHENSLRNRNLQNLLLLTSGRCCPERLMGYVDSLSHYDYLEVADIMVAEGHFEEAHAVYSKFAQRERTTEDKVKLDLKAIEVQRPLSNLAVSLSLCFFFSRSAIFPMFRFATRKYSSREPYRVCDPLLNHAASGSHREYQRSGPRV